MFIRLFALFVIVPLVELYLLLRLSEATSWGTTLAIVIVTGFIGSVLARREGVMAWRRFGAAMAEGRMPSKEIQDGLMIVFAAALLLTPGLITDFVGFSLLVPMGRNFFRRLVLARYGGSFHVQVNGQTVQGSATHAQHRGPVVPGDGGPDHAASETPLNRQPRVDTIDAAAVKHRT
ncbi:FxsA family protein [Rubripirellula reticaptiva]|uniref:Phage T7 F exclusion suppressor FxsA n=1 Tax=Rubripirellula reticaptiva TaxID=2528013 RepID=A0A5C6ESK0_9BACT|nr:FxsA family protein [Rubripirellula reticaptiva]TWU51300.1 phage T7 F exclusion suppressor FxsA [Rubripirellula reticaptiva]